MNKEKDTFLDFDNIGEVAKEISTQTGFVVTLSLTDAGFELSAGSYRRRRGDQIIWSDIPDKEKSSTSILRYEQGRRDGIFYEQGAQAAREEFDKENNNSSYDQGKLDGMTALLRAQKGLNF